MLKIISMKVNGKQHELAVDVRESLADALRNRLALTSVKKGCEVGECGACTVLVDGVSVDSCIYLAVWADGKSILTAVEIVGSGKQYTREELRKLISGHLCRCTGYENILRAVEKAMKQNLENLEQMKKAGA